MRIESVNPANGERLRVFEPESAAAVEEKLASAHAAFATWSRIQVGGRAPPSSRTRADPGSRKARASAG